MKKFILLFLLLVTFSISCSYASDIPGFKYKNIKEKSKISYDFTTEKWINGKKSDMYFIKTPGFGDFSDYLSPNGDFSFTTNCEYEFIANGRLIGYSNRDLTFYEFLYINNSLEKIPLIEEDIQKLLPDYTILKLSNFSPFTNSIKIKKPSGNLKILLYNDINKTFDDYTFSTGNSKIETTPILGIIIISHRGMIQFSKDGENSIQNPWYVILVR